MRINEKSIIMSVIGWGLTIKRECNTKSEVDILEIHVADLVLSPINIRETLNFN